MAITNEQQEQIELFVAKRYGHMPLDVKTRILNAYLEAAKRKEEALITEYGIDINIDLTSVNHQTKESC